MSKLLSIDDDRSVFHLVRSACEGDGVEVHTASTAAEGIEKVAKLHPDAVLLDIFLPDKSGLEAYESIREIDSRLPVIFLTASGASDTAIEAMKLGAFDYLQKPIDLDKLSEMVGQALESRRLMSVPVGMHQMLGPDDKGDAFVGRCEAMQEVFKAIGRVAPQDVTVLIRGDSGTGKELVARAIYQHSHRNKGPFLAVNCAALSETLLESELFGHEKGSFTGANARRIGKFEQCSGGTIFLDEVGDMSPSVQGKVLRLLQEQKFERVGGNETIETDVRIISATNQDLEAMCEEGDFRNDLYYRLNGYTITLPPLRVRQDDRVLLLEHFLARLNRELGREVQGIAPDALQLLLEYDWPGNVREMESVLRQSLLHSTGTVLMATALPRDVRPPIAHPSNNSHRTTLSARREDDLSEFIAQRLREKSFDLYAEVLERVETELLRQVLQHAGGNQSEAARILGITRGSLRNKIRAHHIAIDQVVSVEA